MNAFEAVTKAVNAYFETMTNGETVRACEHSFAVANIAGILAMKRGLRMDIAQSAGMLHDIWLYANVPLTPEGHARHGELGAAQAKKLLDGLGVFTEDEIDIICASIALHDEKDAVHGPYDEILKDADAFAHFVRGAAYDKTYRYEGRNDKVLWELGIR